MRTSLNRITVGASFGGKECLHVWATAEAASNAVRNSPVYDDQMAATTTYHRAATGGDVQRLIYDREGNKIALADNREEK